MSPESRFDNVKLGIICETCTLESRCLVREVVACSASQLWEVFWCVDCPARGFVNVSVQENRLTIYTFAESSPIAKHWQHTWTDWDTP